MGDCKYCRQKAGFLRSKHQECEETHFSVRRKMVELSAQAAAAPEFNEAALKQSLLAIAQGGWMMRAASMPPLLKAGDGR